MSGKKGRSGGRNGSEKVYSEELALEILDRLEDGEGLATICADPGMPDEKTVRRWATEKVEGEDGAPAFAPRYAQARRLGFEVMAEKIIEISDLPCYGPDGAPDNALVQKHRLMADNRKWLLSKVLPKIYGDRVTAEVVGDADRPLVTRIELVPIDPIVQAALSRPTIEHDDGED